MFKHQAIQLHVISDGCKLIQFSLLSQPPIVLSEPFNGGGFARLDGNLSSDIHTETTSSKIFEKHIPPIFTLKIL